MKKYKIIENDNQIINGVKVFRIQALIDIPDVIKKGELGGYIRSEDNLSHEGDCWIHEGCFVYNTDDNECEISEYCEIKNESIIEDSSICGFTKINNSVVKNSNINADTIKRSTISNSTINYNGIITVHISDSNLNYDCYEDDIVINITNDEVDIDFEY